MAAKHWNDKRALNPGDGREPATQRVAGGVAVADNFKVLISGLAHRISHSGVCPVTTREAPGYVSAASDIRQLVDTQPCTTRRKQATGSRIVSRPFNFGSLDLERDPHFQIREMGGRLQ